MPSCVGFYSTSLLLLLLAADSSIFLHWLSERCSREREVVVVWNFVSFLSAPAAAAAARAANVLLLPRVIFKI